MEELVNKTLVFDYFSGKVSPLQKKTIENWLANPVNRDTYYQWLHEWEQANLQLTTNWQTAFQTTGKRIEYIVQGSDDVASQPTRWWQLRSKSFWLVAASLTLFIGLTSWLAADIIRYQTIETAYGETKHYVLPDGSVVDLNANSSIRFPRFGFTQNNFLASLFDLPNERHVELTGEADFSIRHLPTHRKFVVITDKGLNVNVLGTQFTVFSRARRTQVVLRSGKVELTMPQQKNQLALTMKPGDLATLDAKGKLAIQPIAHPEKLSAWKHHRFTFEKTSLYEIAQMLQENYGLVVTIEGDGLVNRTISGSFPAQNANELIKLVAELLQINYFRDNNNVTFTN